MHDPFKLVIDIIYIYFYIYIYIQIQACTLTFINTSPKRDALAHTHAIIVFVSTDQMSTMYEKECVYI